MATRSRNPSVGLNAATGGVIEGWPHVVQSLQDIFTTRFGSRIMREWYGSFVPNLLGCNITPNEVTPWFAAVTSAIEQWEPRFHITKVMPMNATREGRLDLILEGEYRPRAMYGDTTAEAMRRVSVIGGDGRLTVRGDAT
jgi:hypothetical protein